MAQGWTREYFDIKVRNVRMQIGLAYAQWSNDTKYLVEEEQHFYIEEEFQNLYHWLTTNNYHPFWGQFNVNWCLQRLDTLMKIINVLKNDRRGA